MFAIAQMAMIAAKASMKLKASARNFGADDSLWTKKAMATSATDVSSSSAEPARSECRRPRVAAVIRLTKARR